VGNAAAALFFASQLDGAKERNREEEDEDENIERNYGSNKSIYILS